MTEILTPRLRLRPPVLGDLEAGRTLVSAPETLRFVGRTAPDAETHWTKSLRDIGHWTALGYGIFCVFERDSGAHIGRVGLSHFARGLGPDFDPFPEASWVMSAASHGKGLAFEAVQAVHDWFASSHASQWQGRSVCIIDADNTASLKLAARMGCRQYDQRRYQDYQPLVFERQSP